MDEEGEEEEERINDGSAFFHVAKRSELEGVLSVRSSEREEREDEAKKT